MLNTRPHAPVLTSVVCLATAQGKGRRFSRTGKSIHILQPPYPSFGHSKEGDERGREGEQAGWEGGIEGGDKEGCERKCEREREREREIKLPQMRSVVQNLNCVPGV